MKVLFCESLLWDDPIMVGSHHYAERFLASGWDGFWLSHPVSPLHLLHGRTADATRSKFRAWRQGPVRDDGMTSYAPMTFLPPRDVPVLRARWVARHMFAATAPSLPGLVRRLGFAEPDLVWLTNAFYFPLVQRLRAQRIAFRVADDTPSFHGLPETVAELEEEAARRADVVFAASRRVENRMRESGAKKVVYLPNGADVEHFAKEGERPPEYRDASRVAVYVGAIDAWFDSELLAKAARVLPDVLFVVIGPVRTNVEVAAVEPNVTFLGHRPYEEVPRYLAHADVAFVPFKKLPVVEAIHPIKVYEFLAAGLPVVATRWEELERIEAPIILSDAADGFVRGIEEALRRRREGAEERRDFARRNSWDERFRVVMEELGI